MARHTYDSNKLNDTQFAFLLTLVYAAVVSALSLFHEVWQDEAVLLTIVRESGSVGEFLKSLHNYGHPPLFHILLYGAYKLFPQAVVLKILNISICTAAIFVFSFKAPFSRLQKVLFAGGILPLYIYPVINRSYGLAMLLIFIVAALYKYRFRYCITFCAVLVLMAAVHAHMAIIAAGIALSMLFELILVRENVAEQDPGSLKMIFGAVFLAVSMASLCQFMRPDETSIIFRANTLSVPAVAKAFVSGLVIPGKTFKTVFGLWSPLFANIIIFGLYVYLLRKRHLAVLFAFGVVVLTMFFILIYPSLSMRHQGALFLLMIFILWVDSYPSKEFILPVGGFSYAQRYIAENKDALLVFFLIIHVCMGYPKIKMDIERPFASAQDVAMFLQNNPAYRDVILIAESPGILSALDYYIDVPSYLYREKRFGKYTRYTTELKAKTTLDEFLSEAFRLQKDYGKDVLILLTYQLKPQGPYEIKLDYGITFRYSRESLKKFENATVRLAEFEPSLKRERAVLYKMKNQR